MGAPRADGCANRNLTRPSRSPSGNSSRQGPRTPLMSVTPPRENSDMSAMRLERSEDEVDASILEVHQQIRELHTRLLLDIAEQDLLGTWHRFGAKNEEDHLVVNLGVQWRTAKSWVRLGHALTAHPEIAERYRSGLLSEDQLTSVVDAMAAKFPQAISPLGPFDDPSGGTGGAGGVDPFDPSNPSDPSGGAGSPADPSGASGASSASSASSVGGPVGGSGVDPSVASPAAAAEAAATAEAIDELLDLAGRLTPSQLAGFAARLRRRSKEEAAAARRRRHVKAIGDATNSRIHLEGDLFDDAAATVWAALTHFADTSTADPLTGRWDPLDMRFADALEAMATAYLDARGPHTARPTLVIHADARILTGEDGWAETSTYAPLTADAIRRLACECNLVLSADDPKGNPLYLGRTTKTPSWRQVEACRRRDGGCRFPGCGQPLWTNCHHIREWVKDRGPTDYPNLCTLCTRHHHLVHEGGWTITGNACDTVTFTSPDGRITLRSAPNDARQTVSGTAPSGGPSGATGPRPPGGSAPPTRPSGSTAPPRRSPGGTAPRPSGATEPPGHRRVGCPAPIAAAVQQSLLER
ncbi:MAG: hypothetical protein NVS3B12_26670 [Acidimicrobiales bacterium]